MGSEGKETRVLYPVSLISEVVFGRKVTLAWHIFNSDDDGNQFIVFSVGAKF